MNVGCFLSVFPLDNLSMPFQEAIAERVK